MKLCIIESVVAIRADGQVAVFKLLGGDFWGCGRNDLVQVAGCDEPLVGEQLQPGMRVWLNIEQLSADGVFTAVKADDDEMLDVTGLN